MSGRLNILVLSVAAQAFAAPPPGDDPATLLAKAKTARCRSRGITYGTYASARQRLVGKIRKCRSPAD